MSRSLPGKKGGYSLEAGPELRNNLCKDVKLLRAQNRKSEKFSVAGVEDIWIEW